MCGVTDEQHVILLLLSLNNAMIIFHLYCTKLYWLINHEGNIKQRNLNCTLQNIINLSIFTNLNEKKTAVLAELRPVRCNKDNIL